MTNFAGKTVVITGAGGAVGKACARGFLAAGALVIGIDLQSGGDRDVQWIEADLGDPSAVAAAFGEIDRRFGAIDVLVQSAAILRRAGFLELSAEDFDAMWAINVRAGLLCAQDAARSMIASGRCGVIVNLGSVASNSSDAASVGYDASKGGVRSATRGMAVALAPHGIRVVEVAPGPMAQPQGGAERPVDQLDAYSEKRIPLRRWGAGDDVAKAVIFAASDAAGYITGSTIHVDGGVAAKY